MRSWIKRLEREARDNLVSFELEDGSRFYYDRESGELFLHICECLRNHDKPERPEPPELVKALARAKDRRAAYSEVFGSYRDMLPYDEQALVRVSPGEASKNVRSLRAWANHETTPTPHKT